MARIIPPAAGSGSQVVWRPGAAGAGYVTTWAEVYAAFQAVQAGPFTAYLDGGGGGAFTVPAGSYELASRMSFARPAESVSAALTVALADGAILRNPAGFYRSIDVQANNTAGNAIELDDGRAVEFDLNCHLIANGTQPAISVPAGQTARVGFYRDSGARVTGGGAARIATIGAGATLRADVQASPSSNFTANLWTGTGTLDNRYDASYVPLSEATPPTTMSVTKTDITPNYVWSPIDFVRAAAAVVSTAGNFTSGVRFRPMTAGLQCYGIRTFWAGGAGNLRCKLWSPAGVQMATVDVAVGAASFVTARFAAPVAIPITVGAGLTFWHTVSVWDMAATAYTRYAGNLFSLVPTNASSPIPPVGNNWALDMSTGMFVAGDAWPNGTIGNTYLIEPLLQ